ncbi:MAG TPA: twin-arginine translocase TatA/TatE family subunit [Blastocatellia bacterium]|nr:twin-arginine translocase TatA/TatE family subunit [Blastocatellia bacterium]
MGNLGWPEIVIILVLALIIFGPRKLPELGKTLGQSLAQFRRASEDFKRTWEEEVEVEKQRIEAPPAASPESVAQTAGDAADMESSDHGESVDVTVEREESGVAADETRKDWM